MDDCSLESGVASWKVGWMVTHWKGVDGCSLERAVDGCSLEKGVDGSLERGVDGCSLEKG